MLLLFFLLANLYGVFGRASTCSTCAGAVSKTGSYGSYDVDPCPGDGVSKCAWCTASWGVSSSYSACLNLLRDSCGGTSSSSSYTYSTVLTASDCPQPIAASKAVAPFTQTAALVGLGCVCSLVLGIFLYTPCEKLKSAPLPQNSSRVHLNLAIHLLFFAACLMWLSASALLALPTLPWGYYSAADGATFVITLFSLISCSGTNAPLYCYQGSFSDPIIIKLLSDSQKGKTYTDFIASATAIGTCGEQHHL